MRTNGQQLTVNHFLTGDTAHKTKTIRGLIDDFPLINGIRQLLLTHLQHLRWVFLMPESKQAFVVTARVGTYVFRLLKLLPTNVIVPLLKFEWVRRRDGGIPRRGGQGRAQPGEAHP